MVSLNTLRTKFGVLLSVVIAGALLAFIFSLKTEMGFSGNDPEVGSINGEDIHYYKTQYINYLDTVIDTPGEYTELRQTSGALALYAYEADIVGLVLSANEPYSIYSPCITSLVNREVIGIITGIDKPYARPDLVENWLRLAGCKTIFRVSSYT